ncbi:MAG: esterase/lipase family protein [Hyphomonadaceae bacterium]
MAQEIRSGKVAIVTVHGTNDSAPGEEGRKKWWEAASPFCTGLLQRLSARGLEAEIVTHIWTGANSAVARERGAEALAKTIRQCDRDYAGVHVIGHSHGGNVASHAAEIVGWGLPRRRQVMDSLTTIGTPYFKNKFGGREVFGAYAFLALTLISLISLAVLTVMSFLGRQASGNAGAFVPQMIAVGILFAVTLAVFALVLPIALRGVRRVARFRRRNAAASEVLAVWHNNDEAIAFLRKMESFDIRPMPPWGFLRGSRQIAVTIGIWVVLIAAIAALLWVGFNLGLSFAIDEYEWARDLDMTPMEPNAMWTLLGITFAGALALFGLAYLLVRLLFAVADLLTMPWLNGLVRGRIRGMAFGADSDQGIGEVSTGSHTHPTRELILEGAYADRLRDNAAVAANKLLERYRWALFTVEGDAAQALNQLALDAMTWKSLVHTTYFDHEELADIVAEHICNARQISAAAKST